MVNQRVKTRSMLNHQGTYTYVSLLDTQCMWSRYVSVLLELFLRDRDKVKHQLFSWHKSTLVLCTDTINSGNLPHTIDRFTLISSDGCSHNIPDYQVSRQSKWVCVLWHITYIHYKNIINILASGQIWTDNEQHKNINCQARDIVTKYRASLQQRSSRGLLRLLKCCIAMCLPVPGWRHRPHQDVRSTHLAHELPQHAASQPMIYNKRIFQWPVICPKKNLQSCPWN